MPSTVALLESKGLVQPPPWLSSNIHYETQMGSVAYGVSGDSSDMDIYGFCIPRKDMVFPHLAGEIDGFGRNRNKFEQWQQHHIFDQESMNGHGRSHDLTIFSIVKYFSLLMENNPNMIDSLFTPQSCVLHCTAVGQMVREQRRLFLHKGSWFKFKGYAYSQLHKMKTKNPEGKRREIREKFGFDVKYAYHVVRLLDEVEQILAIGDIDIQRSKEHLKAIRRGDVPETDIRQWASDKELALEKLYQESTLRHSPDEQAIKMLLLQCLESHYGSIDNCVSVCGFEFAALQQIHDICAQVLQKQTATERTSR